MKEILEHRLAVARSNTAQQMLASENPQQESIAQSLSNDVDRSEITMYEAINKETLRLCAETRKEIVDGDLEKAQMALMAFLAYTACS